MPNRVYHKCNLGYGMLLATSEKDGVSGSHIHPSVIRTKESAAYQAWEIILKAEKKQACLNLSDKTYCTPQHLHQVTPSNVPLLSQASRVQDSSWLCWYVFSVFIKAACFCVTPRSLTFVIHTVPLLCRHNGRPQYSCMSQWAWR